LVRLNGKVRPRTLCLPSRISRAFCIVKHCRSYAGLFHAAHGFWPHTTFYKRFALFTSPALLTQNVGRKSLSKLVHAAKLYYFVRGRRSEPFLPTPLQADTAAPWLKFAQLPSSAPAPLRAGYNRGLAGTNPRQSTRHPGRPPPQPVLRTTRKECPKHQIRNPQAPPPLSRPCPPRSRSSPR
jgi:hypothetical protein